MRFGERSRRWSARRVLGVISVTGIAILVAACGGSSQSATVTAVGKPVSGGSATYAVEEPADSLDPGVSDATTVEIIDRNIFDSLVVQTGPDSFGPWLATRWTISPDGKTYTFYLKTGVKFQDGTPFDAAAVKATLDHAVNPATKSRGAASLIAAYQSAQVISPYTVAIHLSYPFTPFLQGLSTALLGIQSPAELAKPAGQYVPVGTGPFKFVKWNQNLNVILTRTPTYTSPPSNATHTGPAYLKTLMFDFIAADATRYGALVSGQVDAIGDVPPTDVKTLKATPGYTAQTEDEPGTSYNLYLNVTYGPLADPRVRKAFQEAINVPQLVQGVYQGEYPPATGALTPVTAYYDASAKAPAYAPADAAKLLDAAGWSKLNSAGYRTKDGQELTLVWPYLAADNRDQHDVVADGIVAEAKQLGINVTRPVVDVGTFFTDIESGNYAFYDGSADEASADILRINSAASVKTGTNFSRNSSQQLNGWLTGAAQTLQQATIKQDYQQAQQYVLAQGYVLPIYTPVYTMGITGKFHGVVFDPSGYPLFYDSWLAS